VSFNMTSSIDRWIRTEVRGLSPYQVPEAGGLIKLDAMENPYSWPAPLVDEWLKCLRDVSLNRYPDPKAPDVKSRLRATMGIPDQSDIMLGNGSDELIQIIIMAMADNETTVLAPEPTFVMYRLIASFARVQYVGVPLVPECFRLDMPAMRNHIRTHQPAVIFLAYPNNPTGNLWSREDLEEIISLAPGLVVVDEAYAPFAASSVMDFLAHHQNLLILSTLSKMGLAGLRLGWLIGPADWLAEFDKLRLPYNINVLTQMSTDFALRHKEVFDLQASQIRTDRQRLIESMKGMRGVKAFPSEANFVFFRAPAGRADDIFKAIKHQGVLIKNLSAHGMLRDCLRVTVGKPEENERFLQALKCAL
jgi:histidinol-phosphate aminotransferase